MANDLIDGYARKTACCIIYVATSPLRLAFCAAFTVILPAFVIIAGLMDLHHWGCRSWRMHHWDDWTVLEFPKLTYWDFLVLGRWPEL